jgi:hypothetical protein
MSSTLSRHMSAISGIIEQDLSNGSICACFALCESCFWLATILESPSGHNIEYCPRCLEKEKLSVIPLGVDKSPMSP